MIVLLDNGHGVDTAGKRSPDGVLREYNWTREMVRSIRAELDERGIEVFLVTPEEDDISINARVKRVNVWCDAYGKNNCLLVSLHNNAAGDGSEWMTGAGWEDYVSLNASSKSKALATMLCEEAYALGLKVRRYSSSQYYKTMDLGICRDTKCPAVLTENLFMDNKSDYEYLLSDEGQKVLRDLHVAAIINYISTYE